MSRAVCFGSTTLACDANATEIYSANISYFRDQCDPPETNGIPIGIALGVLGSVGINLGNNLQALGLNVQADEVKQHLIKLEEQGYDLDNLSTAADLPKLAALRRGTAIFGVGWVIFVSASLINFVAFVFAPAAILAPLEAIQVVCQIFLGRLIFKKKITMLAVGSTFVAVLGVVGIVLAVPAKEYNFSMPQLVALWNEPTWVAYLLGVLLTSAVCQVTHVIYQRAIDAGSPKWRSDAITPVTYSVAAAIIGALSVAQAKCMSVQTALLGERPPPHAHARAHTRTPMAPRHTRAAQFQFARRRRLFARWQAARSTSLPSPFST